MSLIESDEIVESLRIFSKTCVILCSAESSVEERSSKHYKPFVRVTMLANNEVCEQSTSDNTYHFGPVQNLDSLTRNIYYQEIWRILLDILFLLLQRIF